MDRTTAAAALRDISATEQRTLQALFRGGSSNLLFMWGGVTAFGYTFEYFQPSKTVLAWRFTWGISLVLVPYVLRLSGGKRWPRVMSKAVWSTLVLTVFGLLIMKLVGPLDARRLDTFWQLLFMLGYALAGIWVGRMFILCGVCVAALTVAGYLWSGPWFPLWMAVLNGGALIAGGWWLRRTGARI